MSVCGTRITVVFVRVECGVACLSMCACACAACVFEHACVCVCVCVCAASVFVHACVCVFSACVCVCNVSFVCESVSMHARTCSLCVLLKSD